MLQNLVAVYSRFMLEKRNKRQLRDAFFALYEFFFLQNNITIVTAQDSCLIISCLRVTIEAFSIVT